ncbi:Haloacid dehalogenase domain protein hydrolase type 3 [Desulfovibrio sp. X2]|uniref:HAD family hydrolase n=1 Tax=Desulfovibrio sp. X2 TaxID=941449 RepID=UPI000358D1E0|nr:HAD family hydrolase [Desulfovibrio sp. X2]EPR44684.1 Haloacid dehalogenase domain protein hydrolase type 3 [Desulfovibrio sp. X2]
MPPPETTPPSDRKPLCIEVPGVGRLELSHLVLDYNGTLALDGELLEGVAERMRVLAGLLTVHVLTADTHGSAADRLAGLPVRLALVTPTEQEEAKLRYVTVLGAARCAAVGNGANDTAMLRAAALGVAVIGREGAASAVLAAASVVVRDVRDGLDLLLRPLRLAATLRR